MNPLSCWLSRVARAATCAHLFLRFLRMSRLRLMFGPRIPSRCASSILIENVAAGAFGSRRESPFFMEGVRRALMHEFRISSAIAAQTITHPRSLSSVKRKTVGVTCGFCPCGGGESEGSIVSACYGCLLVWAISGAGIPYHRSTSVEPRVL